MQKATLLLTLLLFANCKNPALYGDLEKSNILLEQVSGAYADRLAANGKTLTLPNFHNVTGGDPEFKEPVQIFLVIDELACDLCLDRQIEQLQRIGVIFRQTAGLSVVIGSSQFRFAQLLVKKYQLTTAVWLDPEREFLSQLPAHTPLIVVCDQNMRVLAIHRPLPDEPAWDIPFYQWLENKALQINVNQAVGKQ